MSDLTVHAFLTSSIRAVSICLRWKSNLTARFPRQQQFRTRGAPNTIEPAAINGACHLRRLRARCSRSTNAQLPEPYGRCACRCPASWRRHHRMPQHHSAAIRKRGIPRLARSPRSPPCGVSCRRHCRRFRRITAPFVGGFLGPQLGPIAGIQCQKAADEVEESRAGSARSWSATRCSRGTRSGCTDRFR